MTLAYLEPPAHIDDAQALAYVVFGAAAKNAFSDVSARKYFNDLVDERPTLFQLACHESAEYVLVWLVKRVNATKPVDEQLLRRQFEYLPAGVLLQLGKVVRAEYKNPARVFEKLERLLAQSDKLRGVVRSALFAEEVAG